MGKISWRRKWLPIQCFCLDNSMDREDLQATVHGGHKESDTTEWLTLSLHFHTQRKLHNKSLILSSPVKFMSVSIWLILFPPFFKQIWKLLTYLIDCNFSFILRFRNQSTGITSQKKKKKKSKYKNKCLFWEFISFK